MDRIQFYLKATQIRKLKSLAKETGVPMAGLVRKAIDEFLERRKTEKSQVGQK
jgi:predicted DNA-binding protein